MAAGDSNYDFSISINSVITIWPPGNPILVLKINSNLSISINSKITIWPLLNSILVLQIKF